MGDEDRWFKQLFEAFFGDLLSLMVPKLARRLDADRAEFLRGELFADAPETKRREVDLLAKGSTDEHLERAEPLAWALSSLMREENLRPGRHKVEALRRIVRADLSPNRKHLLARCVEYYLELDSQERKEFDDMLAQRENEDVRSFEDHWLNRMERAARQEGKREGKREGKKEGKKEGKQEGIQEGMRQLLLRLLEQRFGSVPETTRRRVEALSSVGELTRLADHVLTADSLEDLGLDG